MKALSIISTIILGQFAVAQDEIISLTFLNYQCDSLYCMSHDDKTDKIIEGWFYSADTLIVRFSPLGGYIQVLDPITEKRKVLVIESNPTFERYYSFSLDMSNGNGGVVEWNSGVYSFYLIKEEDLKKVLK